MYELFNNIHPRFAIKTDGPPAGDVTTCAHSDINIPFDVTGNRMVTKSKLLKTAKLEGLAGQ